MNDLAKRTIAAHGGIEAWRRHKSIHAHLAQGGALWELKANGAQIADVGVTVATDRQWVSHAPFGATGRRSSFSKDRVAIESTDDRVVEELLTPRASFAGHQLSTPWTDLQLAFFVGCAMWMYLNVPFVLAWPQVESKEAGLWRERGESWQRLIVHYPQELEVFSKKQTLYLERTGCSAAWTTTSRSPAIRQERTTFTTTSRLPASSSQRGGGSTRGRPMAVR